MSAPLTSGAGQGSAVVGRDSPGHHHLLDRLLDLVRTQKESVPIEEEVEVIAVPESGKRSQPESREAIVAEVMQ